MIKLIHLFVLASLCLASNSLSAENSQKSILLDEEKVEYAKGLNLGLVYSKSMDKEYQEAFLKGIRDGLLNKTDLSNDEELNALLDQWIKSQLEESSNKPTYAFGWATSVQLLKQDSTIDPVILSQGLFDSFRKNANVMTQKEANDVIMTYSKNKNKRYLEEHKKLYRLNKRAGREFLAKNKEKNGIITLDSGMQYEIISKGDETGSSPNKDNIVKIQVVAKNLSNQVIYDTVTDYGKPLEVKVSSTIKGWQEALVHMKQGEKWRLYVPESLSFQEFGWKDKIAPGETVIFDIHLISIK